MRPAYETLVAALKQDINRVEDYEWTHITDRLLMHATPPERYYLEKELSDLRYEHAAVQLGKLVLGVRDEPKEIRPARNFYNSTIHSMLTPTPYIQTADPRQMELDL